MRGQHLHYVIKRKWGLAGAGVSAQIVKCQQGSTRALLAFSDDVSFDAPGDRGRGGLRSSQPKKRNKILHATGRRCPVKTAYLKRLLPQHTLLIAVLGDLRLKPEGMGGGGGGEEWAVTLNEGGSNGYLLLE